MAGLVVWSCLVAGTGAAPRHAETFVGEVTRVVDGDTLDVRRSGARVARRVRLDGVDTPERGEPFASTATRYLRAQVFAQQVEVRGRDGDRYGRLVARVFARGGDVSVLMVHAGLACVFRKYTADPALLRAEADARRAGRGFWAAGAPKPRCAGATVP